MKIEGVPSVVKQVWIVMRGVLKSKSSALKGKAAHAMKSKVAVLGLIKNKKIFSAITEKLNSLLGNEETQSHSIYNNMALMVYHASAPDDEIPACEVLQQCEQELEYLSHSLHESEQPADNPRNSVSVVEGPRLSTCSVENEIDNLAEDFIRRFRSQMLLQKQNSFQRYREMLDRSV